MNKQTRKIILAASFFIVMMSVAVVPAMATIILPNNHDLKITSGRITSLQNANWQTFDSSQGYPRYYLKWITPDLQFAYQQSYPLTNKQPAYKCDRPDNKSWGDCACFAEAAIAQPYAKSNLYTTTDFRKGRKVMSCSNELLISFWDIIYPGTVIATYPLTAKENDAYTSGIHCHIAVFCNWNVTDSSGSTFFRKCDGFWVWDQHDYAMTDSNGNVITDSNGDTKYYPIIGKHLIKNGGPILTNKGYINNGNASNWYVVHPPTSS
jgi:hypothetical protein